MATGGPTMEMLKQGGGSAAEATVQVEPEKVAPPAAAEKPAKAATKKKTGQKGKAAPKDPILAVGHEVQNLTKAQAFKNLKELVESRRADAFRIGGLLSAIQANADWYKDYESFRAFIDAEYNMAYRTAMQWVEMYNGLIEAGVKWSEVKDIGWTKLAVVAKKLPEDTDTWLARAREMSLVQLRDAIKESNAPPGSGQTAGGGSDAVTMTYKVYPDQKEAIQAVVEKAKEDFNTESPAVALEQVCMTYASGSLGKAVPTQDEAPAPTPEALEAMMTALGAPVVLEAVIKLYDDLTINVSGPKPALVKYGLAEAE